MTRVLYCAYDVLNQDFDQAAKEHAGHRVDVFLLKSGEVQTAIRMNILVWHGKDARESIKTDQMVKVYAGLEEVILSPEDYAQCIEGIYRGTRSRAWKKGVALV